MRKTNGIGRIALIILSLLFSLITGAQTISPLYFSTNAWMPDTIGKASACPSAPCILYGKLHKNWQKVKESGVKLVRFGGIAPDKNMPTNYQYIKMVDSIRANGMEPVLEVPYNDGYYSAAQAAAIVQYVNITKGRNVKYWIIANEPNLVYHYTQASQVAGYIRPFATAMKAVDPSILIIGPEFAGFQKSMTDDLTNPGGPHDITGRDANGRFYIDIFSYHTYPMGDGNSVLPTRNDVIGKLTSSWSFQDELTYLNARLATASNSHSRTGSSALKIAITEANVVYNNSGSDNLNGVGANSFIGGQFIAEMYGIGLRQNVAFVSLWSVIEGNSTASNIGYLDNATGARKPMFYHVQMMAENFSGSSINATDNITNVKTFATKNSSVTNVMIMNQDASANYSFTVRLNTGSVTVPSSLRINVDASIAKEYSDAIPNQSTAMLTFDMAGNLIKKTVYTLSSHAAGNLPPTTYTYAATDLVIQSVTAGTPSVQPNGTVNISATIQNAGSTKAASSNVGFYLSSDASYSQSDLLLTTAQGPTLSGNGNAARSGVVTMPSTLTAGNYFIIAYADPSNAVTELDEANNTRTVALTVVIPTVAPVYADLRFTSASLSQATLSPGATINMSATVQNAGNAAGQTGKTAFYLSTDTIQGNGDILIGSAGTSALPAGASTVMTMGATLPSTMQAGIYHILFRADHMSEVSESNELNNGTYKMFTVVTPTTALPADLRIVMSAPLATTSVAGEKITVQGSVSNYGQSPAAASKTGIFLSSDSLWDSGDLLLGAADISALQPAATATFNATFQTLTKQPAGTYYLLTYADYLQQISEGNEMNNIRKSAISLKARLKNSYIVSSSLKGDQSALTGTLTVIGDDLQFSQFRAFMSRDTVVDATDNELGFVSPGGGHTISFSLPLARAEAGTYNLLLTNGQDTLISTFVITESEVTGIAAQEPADKFKVFPNPTTGRLNIVMPATDREMKLTIYLFDISGRQIMQEARTSMGEAMPLDLPGGMIPGIYILKIAGADQVITKSIIYNR